MKAQNLPKPEPPPDPEVLALRLAQAIKAMHRLVSSRVMQELQGEKQEQELSFSQVAALHQLRDREMTVTALAERTSLSLPAASHLAERLVRRELLRRTENPDNRREKRLALTDLGRAHLARMDTAFTGAYVALFARISPDLLAATEANLQALVRELTPDLSASGSIPPSSETP
ncbi:MarR family transcriptional regulator [Deinococcus petrolearius]|uniref:MarR family transcriptional regulator n=1 Tax=Deinococcus petrolearius TaxID=1751295 RepID=A0ABW1DIG9_9DEIO